MRTYHFFYVGIFLGIFDPEEEGDVSPKRLMTSKGPPL
jgi:hypothetical protein